jgi:hypothetical protein
MIDPASASEETATARTKLNELLKKNGLTRHPKIKAELIPALAGLEDSPWGEWTALEVRPRRMLTQGRPRVTPFAIRSKTLWPPGRRPGTKSESGYSRQQFEAAWASYCEPSATPPQASKFRYLSRP